MHLIIYNKLKCMDSLDKIKKAILLPSLLLFAHLGISQSVDSVKVISHMGGAVTVTNNGISLLPNLTLGKPAVLFNMNVGGKKISFEPEMRFALEGKPWSFIFWGRYKMVNTSKFKMGIGAHPALIFKERTYDVGNVQKTVMVTYRFLAGELTPTYYVNNNTSFGVYYLSSYGMDEGAKYTHFFALRGNFSNIKLFKDFRFRVAPQCYYLKIDSRDGLYTSSVFTLEKQGLPLAISSIVSKKIKSDIAGDDWVWNVSLVYSFYKEYVEHK